MVNITFRGQRRLYLSFILLFLVVSSNVILINTYPVGAETPTEFIKDVQVGFYLRYEEEIYVTWEDWNWENTKVGDAVRRITVAEVGEKNFTVREDIKYSMNLPTDLDYVYVDLETLDGNREELEGGARSSIPGNIITSSINAYYTVDLESAEVLEFEVGGIENEDESNETSQIPLELEHYWSYLNNAANTQEYVWDVVGFPYVDSHWGYSVQPEMDKGKKFDDNRWTVKDSITYTFDGQTQDSMNITGEWKDESNDEVLAEWESEKIYDKDTGLKLTQTWNGDCQVQVYDLGSFEWSLKDGFQIQVKQKLTHTNFRLNAREYPLSTIEILSPNQGALLGDKMEIKVQVNNTLHETAIYKLKYYGKASTSDKWTFLDEDFVWSTALDLWITEKEIDVSSWTGKWNIKVEGLIRTDVTQEEEYLGFVDVFLKPVYIDKLDIKPLSQSTFGPHIDGGLDRIPYDVSFNLHIREEIIGNPQILIDCWYLPLTSSFWSEELGKTVNLEDYWGGEPAYQSLFKALYANKSSGTDPIIGSLQLDKKEIADERLVYVDGGSYNGQGYSYTTSTAGASEKASIENNKATTLVLKSGETASFNFGLYFNNPGNESKIQLRLFSLEVLVDYEIESEGEKQSFTERVQKNIAVRHIEPTITPYDRIIEGISQAFSPNTIIGYAIEDTFGKEYAQAAYQGNYVRYLYYLAMGLDITIRNIPNALSYFGILTGPYWAAVVGTVSIATGVPLPTSWLDLVTEISARAYASVPQEDRVGMWYILLQAVAGVQEDTYVFDPKPIVNWANIISVSGEGKLLNTTLSLKIRTYEKTEDNYYLDFNLTNIGDYPARFLTVYIKGDPPNFWTRHEFEQFDLQPNQIGTQTDIYIGTKDGTYRFDIYFISKPDGISAPVYSKTRGNAVWTPAREFVIPVISEAITAFSPVDIHVYDQDGNHVGADSNGDTEIGIAGTWYSGAEASPESILLSKSGIQTRVDVVGTETGVYKLNFQKSMTLTNGEGEETVVLASFTLSNVKISQGEKHTYEYNFNLLEEEINQLTSEGWSADEAIQYIFSNIDTDEDGISDISDEDPFKKQTSDDYTYLLVAAGAIVVVVVVAFFYLRLKKSKKAKYRRPNKF